MLDIAASSEAFGERIIYDIGSVRSRKKFTDGLTKTMYQAELTTVLRNGTLRTERDQWIVRDSQEGKVNASETI